MTAALEDDFTYVIRKACKGLNLAPAEAARLAGLSEADVLAFSRGKFSSEVASRLAPVLKLNPLALANHPNYLPKPLDSQHIYRLDLPFGEDRVNAWLVRVNSTTILFDTGNDVKSCDEVLRALQIDRVDQIFITHADSDHIGGMSEFTKKNIPHHGAEIRGAETLKPGESIKCGELIIHVHDLSGHASPALGYNIEGLDAPIFVTGDALFAGSIGGCPSVARYQQALETLREALNKMPDETILLPGHGPATTLGEEKIGNPFL